MTRKLVNAVWILGMISIFYYTGRDAKNYVDLGNKKYPSLEHSYNCKPN
jgi:hypothetical protein